MFRTRMPSGHLHQKPREIEAKWGGKCKCEKRIEPGDRVMYYPATRKVECVDCGRETREALADERGGL